MPLVRELWRIYRSSSVKPGDADLFTCSPQYNIAAKLENVGPCKTAVCFAEWRRPALSSQCAYTVETSCLLVSNIVRSELIVV